MSEMGRTNGARGNGQARFVWKKTAYKYDPLQPEELAYLDELARLRRRMFDGKVRSEDKQEAIEARQYEVVGILGDFHYVDITFPDERGA